MQCHLPAINAAACQFAEERLCGVIMATAYQGSVVNYHLLQGQAREIDFWLLYVLTGIDFATEEIFQVLNFQQKLSF